VKVYADAQGSGRGFSLAIMDLTIAGGMGGAEAARAILDFDPAARLVVSSGYSNDPVMAEFRQHGFSAVLTKPYTIEGLKSVLAGLDRG
jgi:two-component system, cell cycle sensor histidine kinase and response regulator CckA